jgi:hypothetical protein
MAALPERVAGEIALTKKAFFPPIHRRWRLGDVAVDPRRQRDPKAQTGFRYQFSTWTKQFLGGTVVERSLHAATDGPGRFRLKRGDDGDTGVQPKC